MRTHIYCKFTRKPTIINQKAISVLKNIKTVSCYERTSNDLTSTEGYDLLEAYMTKKKRNYFKCSLKG